MATSPDYLRLASSAARALADTALDGLRDAVLVVDVHLKHLPVVLANSAACNSLRAEGDPSPLIEVPLLRFLGAESIGALEQSLAAMLEAQALPVFRAPPSPADPITLSLIWKLPHGERSLLTDLKLLPGAVGHLLAMLSFAPSASDVAAAVHHLPMDLLVLDLELRVTYANAGALRTNAACIRAAGIGAARPDGVVGCSALSLAPTSALPAEVYARALRGSSFRDDAVAFSQATEPTRWFEMCVQPLGNGASVTGLLVLYLEVTERRMRARAQGSSERRLLALTEHARDIITVADSTGRVEYVSGGVRNSLGYSSEDRNTYSLFDHVHPEDFPDARAKYNQLVAGEIAGFSKELRVRHKDGAYRWLESSFVSALSNPLIAGIVVNSRDITERKEAEFKLAQREEVFRLAADAVDGVVFEWDITRGVVHRSRGVEEVLGLPPEDMEACIAAWQARVHPRDYLPMRRAVALALTRGRGWTITYRIRDALGRYKSILERGLIQRNAAGDPIRAIGTCVDVSEIKRLTDILAESQHAAKIGGWEFSYLTRELTWSDEVYRIFEAFPSDLVPTWDAVLIQCVPESAERLRAGLFRSRGGVGQLDVELEINTLKGKRLWIRIIGHTERLDGRPFRACGSLQDIQSQKLSQIALENSTAWLKLSMNMAHLHAWRWEKEKDTFEFTTLEGHRVRLPSLYPGMAKMISKVHPKDQAAVNYAIERAFEQHVEVREEFQLQGVDGRYRSYASTARPLFDAANAPSGMVGVMQDITMRRESELRLRQSEELLRTTTANTADTLFLLDTALRVRFINRSVNGMAIDDIIGKEVDVLLPPAARAHVLDKLRRVLDTGKTMNYGFQSGENGKTQWFENHAVAVREDGLGSGISISMRDVTERKRLVQEILDVSGRERQSIGRDLHDGLGQELTGVALMLRGLATRIAAHCPDVVENVNEVVSLVNQSIDTARSLARGLLPVSTESGGLSFALRALAGRGRELYGLNINFRGDLSAEFHLNETDASHLYRIAQEALTNSARHAQATRVDIVLLATAQSFWLRISDDGVGFKQPVTSTGLGLKIMKYRAGMIGATFDIGVNDPRGSMITVTNDRAVTVKVQSGMRHSRSTL